MGSPGSYAAHYSLETQKTASADAIWRLCEANFKATDSALFFEANIDLQSFINYLCASALTQNWDAYNKNHFLALDRRSKKWFVIPWDLNEEGFDGSNSYQPQAQGVPKDRVVGMHLLGDYSSFNVLQTTAGSRRQVRVKVTRGKYAFARFVVTGGNGDSEMPVRFEFSDGTTRRAILPCDDWYDDNPPDGPAGSVHEGAVPILNGLDRFRHGAYKDKNDAALFEVSLPVDPKKELVAFILEVDQARYSQPGTCFNLFAATGILARGK